MPVVELAQRSAAAARYFEACRTPAGWDFDAMRTTAVTLLSPGILNVKAEWLVRARLWRLILSQSTGGWWEANNSTAFALEARFSEELVALPHSWWTRASDFARGFSEALADSENAEHALTQALENARASKAGSQLSAEDAFEFCAMDECPELDSDAPAGVPACSVLDCPLTNSGRAIRASIPRALRDAAAGNAAINAPRVWATMLAVALLERQRFCWLWVRCMRDDRVATHSFDASRCASIAGRWRCVSRG
jgi:hypothetical protein